MLIEDVLNEKHYTGPLYHAAPKGSIIHMLNKGYYDISHTHGSERGIKNDKSIFGMNSKSVEKTKDYYYLSTSRDKLNRFRKLTSNAGTFVLNTQYFSNNPDYRVIPVDFFNFYKLGDMRSESEERIFSKVPHIPLNGSTKEYGELY